MTDTPLVCTVTSGPLDVSTIIVGTVVACIWLECAAAAEARTAVAAANCAALGAAAVAAVVDRAAIEANCVAVGTVAGVAGNRDLATASTCSFGERT